MTIEDNSFSSLEPTAANTLYYYKILLLSNLNINNGAIIGANLLSDLSTIASRASHSSASSNMLTPDLLVRMISLVSSYILILVLACSCNP